MTVGLVADVPHDAVVRRVEDAVQGEGEFDRTEVRRQVAARFRDRFDQEGTQLGSECIEITTVERAQVCGRVDPFKKGVGGHGGSGFWCVVFRGRSVRAAQKARCTT